MHAGCLCSEQEYMCDRLAPNPKQGSFGVAPRVTQGADAFGPGPGHYQLKTCVGDTFSFSMRGREKFGNPTGKSDDPTTATEPGPGQYPKVRVCWKSRRGCGVGSAISYIY
jgi:hypothetical protein